MTLIQVRRGSASAWTTANPTLAAGELGVETDTLKLKVGNGSTAWASLAYQGGGNEWEPFTNLAAFPGTGDTAKEYVAVDTGKIYRWNGSAYVEVSVGEPTITAGTTSQYWRGDKTFQTLDKTAVGLANVDNTADTAKPVSTAQQTALNLKAPLASPAFTGTPTGITQTHVGLGNVDNTSNATERAASATLTNKTISGASNTLSSIPSSAVTPAVTSVAYAATVTPNADTTRVLNIGTLTGNITIANPTGTPGDGQPLRIRFTQDATGGRTLTWGSAFAFGTDVTTALIPTAANAKWVQLFAWDATSSTWRALAIARGF